VQAPYPAPARTPGLFPAQARSRAQFLAPAQALSPSQASILAQAQSPATISSRVQFPAPAPPPPPAKPPTPPPANGSVITVRPPVAGVPFLFHGGRYVSDANGNVSLPATAAELANDGVLLHAAVRVPPTRIRPNLGVRFDRWVGKTATVVLLNPVRLMLVDPAGEAMDPSVAPGVLVRGSDGSRLMLPSGQVSWLSSRRAIVRPGHQWRTRRVAYTIQEVRAHGGNVVHRDQQRFFPAEQALVTVHALFFTARFSSRDALFGRPVGKGIVLRFPDGHIERHPLLAGAERALGGLPRGAYDVSVDGGGISFSQPVALSKSQEVKLQVVTWLDIGVVGTGLLIVAVGLAVARRPQLRRQMRALGSVSAGGRGRG
jgi:hypothetical protein